MEKENKGFCIECREECEYELKKVKRHYRIKDKDYEMYVTVALCKNCGEEIEILGIVDKMVKEVDEQYRTYENIITIDEINKLMEIYNIGKAPLSLALGFGEITITRYIQGQVPSKEYSDIMRSALETPGYMMNLLNTNKDKIGETAYNKALKACNNLKIFTEVSNKMLSTISYIFNRADEVTPLALQKILYFIQGIYMVCYDKPLYEEDCLAWVHGPVYKSVYDMFKSFRYNPIDDSRFAILKNRFHELTEEEKEIIDLVIDSFGMYSGKALERITHNEEPWIHAREGYLIDESSNVVIDKNSIYEYFKKVSKQYDIKNVKELKLYISNQLEKQ